MTVCDPDLPAEGVEDRLSNTLDGAFRRDVPDGASAAGVRAGVGGRGRCLDNVFVGRLWPAVTCGGVYIRGYGSVPELGRGPRARLASCNGARPHPPLGHKTPAEVGRAGRPKEPAGE